MIDALAHDLGKASGARFGDHVAASAEMLRKAGFLDGGTLSLVERHHKNLFLGRKNLSKEQLKKFLCNEDNDPNLYPLQLADRLASSQRADGGSSAAFIPALDYNYLRLTEAYLLHDLSEYFLKFGDDYNAFRRFVRNCWWLELVKASVSDASNASLREHLLLTDSIYQIYLGAVERFEFGLEGRKAKDWLRYRLLRIREPAIEGRPKDLWLRVEVLKLLEGGERSAYQVWKGLREKGVSKDKRFVGRVLEELETVKALKRDDDKRYSLNMSLAPKHSLKEASCELPSDEKIPGTILKMHSVGFSIDGTAYEVGLPTLHVKLLKKVLSKMLRREVLNDGVS